MGKLDFKTLGNFLLAMFFMQVMLHSACGRSNGSTEHAIRKSLLDDYDLTVLPSKGPVVNVEFGFKLERLVKVDSKQQLITVDAWVVMKWNNTFFSWNKDKYGGKNRVHFLPTEVWFPDIALYNNGDSNYARAGGRSMFLSNVVITSQGLNIWSGPASFTASCTLKLNSWPFDTQQCDFRFGSFSYNSRLLVISSFVTKSDRGNSYVDNGDWTINSIDKKIGTTDHGNCCPYDFAEITYTIKMTRKFQYQMFYLVAPCLLLSILTLISFWIPSESGERIGFVTTLLLGMMVFLLVVPDSLPESSQSVPVLGILLMCTLVLITLVLLATIAVLRCFHATGTPPKYLQCFSKPTEMNHDASVEAIDLDKQGRSVACLRAVHPFQGPVNLNTALNESNITPSWQRIACRLDSVFFCIFLVINIVLYAVLLSYRD